MKHKGFGWQKSLPYVLFVGGVVGLLASFALTYDKLHVLQDPNYIPSCNLNPILSCGSVMSTSQATLLGVPNTIFGLIAFSMLSMFGLVLLTGAVLQRWLWLGAQAMATAGVLFMHYLFFESVFRIHAICPWCFIVWMITIPIFFGITIHTIRTNNIHTSRFVLTAKIAGFIDKYCNDILILWYSILAIMLLTQFWYYWKTLL